MKYRYTITIDVSWVKPIIDGIHALWMDWHMRRCNPMAPHLPEMVVKRATLST